LPQHISADDLHVYFLSTFFPLFFAKKYISLCIIF
jgi:hypothetical protein